MYGQPLESRCKQLPFESYSFGLLTAILNPQSTMSGDIDVVMIRSAVVENVGYPLELCLYVAGN